MKNEKTGKRVAAIAGRLLEELKGVPSYFTVWVTSAGESEGVVELATVKDIKALAASALTQSPPKVKR